MNPNHDPDFGTAMTVDTATTLRLPAGSAVFALRGEAWLTQGGSPDDVILAPGDRFNVPSRAPLVVSAMGDSVDLYVVRPAVARLNASCAIHDLARARAAELRRAEFEHLTDVLVRRMRSVVLRARAALAPGTRVPTH